MKDITFLENFLKKGNCVEINKNISKDKYKFIQNISTICMQELLKESLDYTLVNRGSYFWGRGGDILSPDAGPCIIVGIGSPVKKIFHDSSWNDLENYLSDIEGLNSAQVIATGTSIIAPYKKHEINIMYEKRRYAEKTLINKFGKENVDICWSKNKLFTTVFYDSCSNKFYRSVEFMKSL